MRSVGTARRIDQLGRVVVPAELRKILGIRKGDPPEDLAAFVLSDFPPEDVLVVQEVVGWAADLTTVQDAAFARYSRSAVDYAP